MNNLTKPQNEIQKTSSLSLAERLKAVKSFNSSIVLLLDISGSMCSDVEPGQSRLDTLKKIVTSLVGKPRLIAFNNFAVEIIDVNLLEARGGTHMSRAIICAKELGFKSAIMLTDGDASRSDEELAINEVKDFNLQIMYIGSGEKPEFLNRLATKGFATKEDLTKPKELTEKIQLLLGAGGDETNKTNKPICL